MSGRSPVRGPLLPSRNKSNISSRHKVLSRSRLLLTVTAFLLAFFTAAAVLHHLWNGPNEQNHRQAVQSCTKILQGLEVLCQACNRPKSQLNCKVTDELEGKIVVLADCFASYCSLLWPWQRSGFRGDGINLPLPAPRNKADILVVYVFSNTDAEYEANLRFFLKHGVHGDDGCDYLIVIQTGGTSQVSKYVYSK